MHSLQNIRAAMSFLRTLPCWLLYVASSTVRSLELQSVDFLYRVVIHAGMDNTFQFETYPGNPKDELVGWAGIDYNYLCNQVGELILEIHF